MFTHIIFDNDGLLLDTENIYTKCYQQLLSKWGHQFDNAMKLRIMGTPALESAKIVVSHYDLPISAEDFAKMALQEELESFGSCSLMPGAKELIERLYKMGVKMAVATSSNKLKFELKTRSHQYLYKMMDVIVTGDDPSVERGKPNPDIFLVAAERLGVKDKGKCLVLEDSPNGVIAGISAGMHVAWIPDQELSNIYNQTEHFRSLSNVLYFKSLLDFDPSIFFPN